MLFLTAVAQEPDYIALALVAVLAVIVVIKVFQKRASKKAKAAAQAVSVEAVPAAESGSAPTAPGSAGRMKIYDVEPKTAAMLMAIVADQLGKPLNELRFISIKEVK